MTSSLRLPTFLFALLTGLTASLVAEPAAAPTPAKSYDYWLTGNPADAHPARTRAGLFLAGGGGDVAAAWRWFVGCAGGGDIVVLRASGGDALQDYIFTKIGGVDSVETIKFNDPSAAQDPRVLEIISHADGIFLAGGDQSKYVNWWKDSPVGKALNAHIAAGKPIGGTSAGLAVLGEYYFAAFHSSITSDTALRNPYDRSVTVGHDFISAPALAGVLTDTHFMARSRLGRLITFMARTIVDEKPKHLVGLGIDEMTAACVEPDGKATIFTEKDGCAWLVLPTKKPEQVVPGKPLIFRRVQVLGAGPDSVLDLGKGEVRHPKVTRIVTAIDGKLVDEKESK